MTPEFTSFPYFAERVLLPKSQHPEAGVHAKSFQSCPGLCNPIDCSPPGSSVHGILQARILEWLPFSFPGDLPDLGIKALSLRSPALAGRFFTSSTTWKSNVKTTKKIFSLNICLQIPIGGWPSDPSLSPLRALSLWNLKVRPWIVPSKFTLNMDNFHHLWRALVAQMVKNLPAMPETRVWSLGWEDLLEKGMATQSSISAWRIPWTEEPGGLQSMGSHRVGHDWVTNTLIGRALSRASSIHCLVYFQKPAWALRSSPMPFHVTSSF